MIETIFSSGSLTTVNAFLVSLVIGVAFGWCLEQAGFGSSRRLAGIFYFRDMAVLKVMFSAVITAMLGLGFALAFGIIRLEAIYIPETILGAQIIGGFLFGIGFMISGWCPGTAAVGAVSGKLDAIVFLIGALLGSYVFNSSYSWIEPWYNWGDMGVSYIYSELGFEFAGFALLVTIVAILAFWVAELIEVRFNFALVAAKSSNLWAFSVVILSGAIMLVALGRVTIPRYRIIETGVYASGVLSQIEKALEHIEPEDLARELLVGQKRIVVADLRSREEFDEWHIPGSVHTPMSSIMQALERYRAFDRIVLVSNGATHPGQAWVVLQGLGFTNVYTMSDGLRGFFERVLKPVSLRMVTLTNSEQAEINLWRTMFLGSGMAVGSASQPSSGSE
ncbi:MAG: YeeE/YedE family protein [Candidatus Riflebacteria bacterium]|nr:YeeE/YedE family protein [Candidatus Riflebacteria bacterium]